MLEINLLKYMLNKEQYLKTQGVPLELNKECSFIAKCIGTHFQQHEEAVEITIDDLTSIVFANGVKDKEYYEAVLTNIRTSEATASTTESLLTTLATKNKLKELSLLAYEAYEGKKDLNSVTEFVSQFNLNPVVEALDVQFVTDDLNELITAVIDTPGLRWRLNTMNRMMGSLRKGNFGFVYARPESGKTTFLASEVTYMCTQLKDDDGPILWIANEEPGQNVKLRIYQAFFGIGLSELRANSAEYSRRFKEESRGKIKVHDDQSKMHRRDIEKIAGSINPSLVIIDQLDKIEGFDDDREDLKLGAIYRWAREIAKRYCPVIAVCQADGTGEGVQWLTMGNVANAKTAKQAEADWILGIGKSNKEGYESIRYLHLSKNKLIGDSDTDPGLRHGKCEVVIEPMTARYKDLF